MILHAALLSITAALPFSWALQIKLKPGETLEEIQHMYPNADISPLFTLSYERLILLSSVEEGLPDLTLWYKVDFPATSLVEQTEEEIAASLESLDSISDVEIPKIVVPPQVGSMSHSQQKNRQLAATGNFEANQEYLRTTLNNGIDAVYSWTFDGGDGEGVTIYDVGKWIVFWILLLLCFFNLVMS